MFNINKYDPNEFLPIYVEGELANRAEFVGYKFKKAANKVIDGLDELYFKLMD